jgi:hypothetical protein
MFVDSLGAPRTAEPTTFNDLTRDDWMPAGATVAVSGSGGLLVALFAAASPPKDWVEWISINPVSPTKRLR